MALIPSSRYPGQTDTGDPGYPHGKARNSTTFQDGTGTPRERDGINDSWGFHQALLAAGRVVPSGDPDEVGSSQYLQALQVIVGETARSEAEKVVLANWEEAVDFPNDTTQLTWIAGVFPLFLAMAAGGKLRTSPDGITWTARSTGISTRLRAAATSLTVAVIVGDEGTILRSTDGITWSSQTSGTSEDLRDVTYAIGLYVAVGTNGTILTSPDGITWTSRTSGLTTEDLYGVTSNVFQGIASLFVAVGSGTESAILTSPDAVTWTARSSGTTDDLLSIAWKLSVFVAVGGAGKILSSSNGITWSDRPSGTTEELRCVIATAPTAGHFLAIGDDGALVGSSNGLSWRPVINPYPTTFEGLSVAWNGFVAIGSGNSATDNAITTIRRII